MSNRSLPRRNPLARTVEFVGAVRSELKRTVWPSRSQLTTYTLVVLAFLVFMVAVIGLTDAGVSTFMGKLLG